MEGHMAPVKLLNIELTETERMKEAPRENTRKKINLCLIHREQAVPMETNIAHSVS